jgi:thiol-disulfide isomerase/thioredoxin
MIEEGRNMKIRIVLISMLLMAACTAVAAQQAPKATAPPDPQVIDALGLQKILDQYRGKPLVLTFWATWCEPCRDEYPLLNELAKQYAPQGLKVVGVSMDDDGDIILMRRFLARYKPIFPNFRKKAGGEVELRQVASPGWGGSMPATFFYAKDGRKAGEVMGEGKRETFEQAIRSLLGSENK